MRLTKNLRLNKSKKIILLLIIHITSVTTYSQDVTLNALTELSSGIYETSGLIWLENRLITHNDSGGEATLYEIDTATGEIMRNVVVANANNQDWEDICQDENFIYIGDFGNNAGTRTDLRIYKISIVDYLTTPNDTVYCDTISFSYSDQIDFTPATYTTNFDAEAFIFKGDSLYIFTKNWGDYRTNIYACSKNPGTYSLNRVDQVIVECLVTGAAYDSEKNELLLTGYTLLNAILVRIGGIVGSSFSTGEFLRLTAGVEGSIQMEGVAAIGNHQFFVSSEKQGTDAATLHLVTFSNFVGIQTDESAFGAKDPAISTNTIIHELTIIGSGEYSVSVYTNTGKLVKTSNGNSVNFSDLENGIYIIHILDKEKNVLHSERVLKVGN